MTSQDFLNYSAGIAIWIFLGLGLYVGINLVKLFSKLQRTTKIALKTALEVQLLKNTLRKGVLGFLEDTLRVFLGGGVSRGGK